MPERGRLIAVNDVELESRPGIEEELLWFYGEVGCLETAAAASVDGHHLLRFKSDRVELRILVVEPASVESVACRISLEIPSIIEAAVLLEERGYPFAWYRGLRYTDRSLRLLDPAGNRAELRPMWRGGPF